MAKSKNLCKKPLLILSLCIVIAFAAALIIMAVVPYAATPYKYASEDEKTQIEYVFKKDVYEKTTKTEFIGSNTNTIEIEYTIEDGVVKEANTSLELGKINAYELVIGDTVYTNTFTKVLKIVSIVGVSLGGVGLVLYFVLNNKNGKTKKSSKKK